MKEFWDTRYKAEGYAYGTEPNQFLKEEIEKYPVGSILLPAEGEGRNAVYCAKLGWDVDAFDISVQGQIKAQKLAEMHNVKINYQVGEFNDISFQDNKFDAIGLIFAHFSSETKSGYLKKLNKFLKVGGHIFFVAFSKGHLSYNSANEAVGGPKDINMLFSINELKEDFNNYEFINIQEIDQNLSEGKYHLGMGRVIQFTARKLY